MPKAKALSESNQNQPAPIDGQAMQPLQVLERYFGYHAFRPDQEPVIEAILAGRDTLAVMSTGAGKSICYQVPALCLDGLTLVVSPLISLMKDQVTALEQAGISAAYLNSTQEYAQRRNVLERAERGQVKLLYVAPERLGTEEIAQLCRVMPPVLVAIDEAHCISQWGQDFRPSYTQISAFVEGLATRPTLCAFTATATRAVRDDILASLGLHDPYVLVAGSDRPNLHFEVRRSRDKDSELLDICRAHKDRSGIVYCLTRKTVEEVAALLKGEGIPAVCYHAGLDAEIRHASQEDFVYDRARVVVATCAFGMGIDKSDVGFVVHYNLPMDVESYYQEAGRAGRDGESADCILLYTPRDVQSCKFLISKGSEGGQIDDPALRALLLERAYERLRQMTFYATTHECLRHFLLGYFGEEAPATCGNCSNCETEFESYDVIDEARKIVSCVYRLRERDRTVGKAMIVSILHGAKTEKIRQSCFDTLSVYGIMASVSPARINAVLDTLLERGYLSSMGAQYPVVVFSDESMRFLREEKVFTIEVPKEQLPQRTAKKRRAAASVELTADDEELFERLRSLRKSIAQEEDVPAYVVFSNTTLIDMCRRRPISMDEFLEVSGVGQVKADRYGQRFLEAIETSEG